MNVYVGFGIFGIVSGIVAAFADVPLKKCGVKIIGALGVGCALLSVLLIIVGIRLFLTL